MTASGANAFPVPVLMGPTGSGKTALSAQVDPQRYEIVSCDSRQLYRELEIGSAAPEPAITARIRHHLIGILSPADTCNAAEFRRLALAAIDDVRRRGKIPFLVGGSGFYYRALKSQPFDVQVPDEIRASVQALSPDARLERLRALDPGALVDAATGEEVRAGKIHPNDAYRVGRALEVCLAAGRPWSSYWSEALERESEPGLSDAGLRFSGWLLETADRDAYHGRLRERARAMIDAGLIEEAGRVYERYGDCPGLQTLGYDLALQAYRAPESLSRDELAERLAILHRQYGKRQRTWLRRETELDPVRAEDFAEAWRKRAVGG